MSSRFIISDPPDLNHSGSGFGITWIDYNGFITCGDDHKLIYYDSIKGASWQLLELPRDFYPTTIDCVYATKGNLTDLSGNLSLSTNIIADGLIVGSDDGRICFINQFSKAVDKIIDAHKGSILCLRWSKDFSSICSSGEDGQVKVWSKSGLLRSIISSNNSPVYTVCWSPKGDSILFSQHNYLIVKSVMISSQEIRWKAHDELITDLDWSFANNLILSCGFDCRYKIFESNGNLLYSSKMNDQPIQSVSWSSNGLCFVHAAINCLTLSDFSGLALSQIRLASYESIASIKFNLSSNDFGIILSSGRILNGFVLINSALWGSIEVIQTDRKTLSVKDYDTLEEEKLDYAETIEHFIASHGHLLVLTKSECYIHKLDKVNTPQVVTLKQRSYNLIVSESNNFALCDINSNFNIYTYDAKLITSLKLPAFSGSHFNVNPNVICLCNDSLSIPDLSNNSKNILVHYFRSGHPMNDHILRHHLEIIHLSVYKSHSLEDGVKIIAYIDANTDLFLYKIDQMNQRLKSAPRRLDTNCRSIHWNESMKVLAASKINGTIQLWLYPEVALKNRQVVSEDLMDTIINLNLNSEKMSKQLNKSPGSGSHADQITCTRILNFSGNYLSIETNGQRNYIITINPIIETLHALYNSNELGKALKLWRQYINETKFVLDEKETTAIWTMLAFMSIEMRDDSLEVARECFAELGRVDVVEQLEAFKDNSTLSKDIDKRSDIFLLSGDLRQASMLLATNNNLEAAIDLHLEFYKFNDAIKLATMNQNELLIKHVLRKRSQYLEEFNLPETNSSIIKLMKEINLVSENSLKDDDDDNEPAILEIS